MLPMQGARPENDGDELEGRGEARRLGGEGRPRAIILTIFIVFGALKGQTVTVHVPRRARPQTCREDAGTS